MQFVDTPNQDLKANGWNIRLQHSGDQHKCELTFKRRVRVDGEEIDSAWEDARNSGLTVTRRYRKQVEWNVVRRTLSFSIDRSFEASENSTSKSALPNWSESISLAHGKLPGRLRRVDINARSCAELLAVTGGSMVQCAAYVGRAAGTSRTFASVLEH
jgi:hypothetical protein